MSSSFEICLGEDSPVALDELTTPLDDPVSSFRPTATTKRSGANAKRGLGLPVATWEFKLLDIDQRNQLKVFCAGASSLVTITTKTDDDSYETYTATMNWPDDDTDRWYGERKNVTIEFVNLVVVEGS